MADTATKPKKFPDVRHEYLKRDSGNQVFAVMREGGGLPTVLHADFNGAAFQAARLAHENPGQRFHVLASHRVSFAEPIHASDCALHNEPASPAGPCDCGAEQVSS